MEQLLLNDLGTDITPIHVIELDEKIDEEELKKSIEKNRKLIENMRNDADYKRIMAIQNVE